MGIAFQSLKHEDAENIGYVIPTPVIMHFIQDYEKSGAYTGGFRDNLAGHSGPFIPDNLTMVRIHSDCAVSKIWTNFVLQVFQFLVLSGRRWKILTCAWPWG